MSNLTPNELRSRHNTSLAFICLLFVVVAGRLFDLQVLNGERYLLQSEQNYMRITPIPAPRGDIIDADGRTLVTSRPSFSVFYWYLDAKKAEETLPRLCGILGIDPAVVEEKVKNYAGRYFEPIPIAKDIAPDQYTSIVEDAPNLPGVFIEAEPIRYYTGGGLASATLGYVSEITAEQLKASEWAGYKMGDTVGQQGLESYYEKYLRGQSGGYQVEVDYRGRPTGHVGEGIEPVPGYDVYLNLKASLQEALEEACMGALAEHPKAKSASAVVLDVKTGGVLAMVSVPGFDANKLVTGITQAELNMLLDTGSWRFSNLAITGMYPPGSSYKIVSAIAALAEGVVTPEEKVYDPGYHPMVPSLPCNVWGGHGSLNIVSALARSCNVFFYEMGRRLGVDRMAEYATVLGLGSKTGVDLFGENYGTVPSTEWKAKAYEEGRVAEPQVLYAEHMMAAMGQAFHLDTPIQMASVVQAIANGGTRMRPRLAEKIVDSAGETVALFPPEVASVLEVEDWVLDIVTRGMRAATSSPEGTAYASFWDLPFETAGKTGTAENPSGESHAWFVGFAPYEEPEIAVSVVVDQGGGGGAVAAPIARAAINSYFADRLPAPPETPF